MQDWKCERNPQCKTRAPGRQTKKDTHAPGRRGNRTPRGSEKKATRNAHAGMPTKEKGKALTWMNEKKAKRTLRDCQNESNKAERNATPGCKKRKNAAMRNVRPGATRTKRKGILINNDNKLRINDNTNIITSFRSPHLRLVLGLFY